MTDTASASGIIFDLFWLLGYQFSPRLSSPLFDSWLSLGSRRCVGKASDYMNSNRGAKPMVKRLRRGLIRLSHSLSCLLSGSELNAKLLAVNGTIKRFRIKRIVRETGQYSISDLAKLFVVPRPTGYRTLSRGQK